MNLLVGQHSSAGASGGTSIQSSIPANAAARLFGIEYRLLGAEPRLPPSKLGFPSAARNSSEGLTASNRFADLLVDVRSNQLDFRCHSRLEERLTERGDVLVEKLLYSLCGIVTRVDVDNLSMLRLCVNALVAEKAELPALKYARFARDWCKRADFTDSVATGSALTATAEMFYRLHQYEDAAYHFRASATAFENILEYQHPLTAYCRKRLKMTLTKLAFNQRPKNTSYFGAGYCREGDIRPLSALVWEGPVST